MSILLHIETSGDRASICLSENDRVLALAFNESRNDHAAWLHTGIDKIFKDCKLPLQSLEAVSVSIGPGSYTGLRIGLSAAKGICYALNIPLITVSTLKMMASSVVLEATELICPLIDARRMEVYAAVYDTKLSELTAPHALILDETSFSELLREHHVVFCGNGSPKFPIVQPDHNIIVSKTIADASHLCTLAWQCFLKMEFADTVYAEPAYIKEFYSAKRKD